VVVSLVPINDPANVVAALAQGLGLHEEGDHYVLARLMDLQEPALGGYNRPC